MQTKPDYTLHKEHGHFGWDLSIPFSKSRLGLIGGGLGK